MRIAFISFEFPPFIVGGAGVYARNMSIELAKLGHQVFVFTPQIDNLENDKYIFSNIKIRRISINRALPFKALQFWLHLPSAIKEEENENKFDIIHFNAFSYWFLKTRLSKASHVITVHHLVTDALKNNNPSLTSRFRDMSGETSLFIPFIEKRCIGCADKIITISNFTKKQIIKTYRISPNKIEVIYNGIDMNGYSFNKAELEETKKLFNIPQKPIILFVGRVDDQRKGLDMLMRSFKIVLEKINSILLIVGKGDQTKARTLAITLGIQDNVFFTGFVDEITLKKCYALCDVYAVPSRLEGFGLTILEAMAAGKPVVATNVGAIPEIIKNGENATLVQLDDIFDFANSLYSYINNGSLAESITDKNKIYIQNTYNWGMNALATQRIYMALINSNRYNSSNGFE